MPRYRQITALQLEDFRNYERWDLEPGPGLTVLVGPNAAGKTNVVEAVRLLTAGRSLRSARWDELVHWGSERAIIRMTVECDGAPTQVAMEITSAGRRETRLGGKKVQGCAKLAALLPSVVFTPDDLDSVKRAAEVRRRLIDDLGSELSGSYDKLSGEYARVVRQRNAILREPGGSEHELAAWTEQLVARGARLAVGRLRLLRRIAARTRDAYRRIAGAEELGIGYASGWLGSDGSAIPDPTVGEAETAMRAELEARAGDERARGLSLVGPHRDDVVFTVDGREARAYGSQGQQRSIALAWKLAEVQVVEEMTGTAPVLLLDDVMSELDETRRHALTRMVQRDAQTIVTTTNLGYFEASLLDDAKVVALGATDA